MSDRHNDYLRVMSSRTSLVRRQRELRVETRIGREYGTRFNALDAFWRKEFRSRGIPYTSPGVEVVNEPPARGAPGVYVPIVNTIMLERQPRFRARADMMMPEIRRHPGTHEDAVVAHEFGHHITGLMGLNGRLLPWRKADIETNERNADYLVGYYAQRSASPTAAYQRRLYEIADSRAFMGRVGAFDSGRAAGAAGDFRGVRDLPGNPDPWIWETLHTQVGVMGTAAREAARINVIEPIGDAVRRRIVEPVRELHGVIEREASQRISDVTVVVGAAGASVASHLRSGVRSFRDAMTAARTAASNAMGRINLESERPATSGSHAEQSMRLGATVQAARMRAEDDTDSDYLREWQRRGASGRMHTVRRHNFNFRR